MCFIQSCGLLKLYSGYIVFLSAFPMKIHFAAWENCEQHLRQIIDLLSSKEEWKFKQAAEINLRAATSKFPEIYLV